MSSSFGGCGGVDSTGKLGGIRACAAVTGKMGKPEDFFFLFGEVRFVVALLGERLIVSTHYHARLHGVAHVDPTEYGAWFYYPR